MDALTDFYGDEYRVFVRREDWDSVSTDIRIWQSGDAFFTLPETTPFHMFRPQWSSDKASDRLVVIVELDAEQILDIGGVMHRMRPGAVAIYDSKQSLHCKGVTGGRGCWFGASYDQLGISPDQVRTPIFLDPETVQAQALKAQTQLVANAFMSDSSETSALLQDALFQVLRGLLTEKAPDRNSDSFKLLRWRNIQAFIEANLGQRDLNANLISERFGMSRAVVYRAFESHGGVTAYIRERRLDRVFKLLAREPHERVQLGQLSEALGFVDSAYLSNSFRQAYGTSPSAVRNILREQGGSESPVAFLSGKTELTVSGVVMAA